MNNSQNNLSQSNKEGYTNTNRDFSSVLGVEDCSYDHLQTTFEVLLLQKKKRQQDLADYLGVNRSYVSRMVHGTEIPPLRVRLKVAEFFGCDSVLIWRIPQIQTADKLKQESAEVSTETSVAPSDQDKSICSCGRFLHETEICQCKNAELESGK